MFDNPHNYVRADSLDLLSVEFFSVMLALFLFLFQKKKSLVAIYLISLPYTDVVYRVFSLQPTDIVALLIIAKYIRLFFGKLTVLYLILFVFFAWGFYGFLRSDSLFGILYTIRILFIFVVLNILTDQYFRDQLLGSGLLLLRQVFILSIAVSILQAILWVSGLPVNGVFYQEGLLRVKGLAHEPSTFAMYIVFSIPFLIHYHKIVDVRRTSILLTTILFVVGILLTSSTMALAVLVFGWFISLFMFKNSFYYKLIPLVFAAVLLIFFHEQVYSVNLDKAISYVNEMTGGSAEDNSGRAGDKLLINDFHNNPVFGIGAFRSSLLDSHSPDGVYHEEYIPASNIVYTSAAEFGALGSIFLLAWFVMLFFYIRRFVCVANVYFFWGWLLWIFSLFGARLFAFHQPWLMLVYIVLIFQLHKYTNSVCSYRHEKVRL